MKKIIRITTISGSMRSLLKDQLRFIKQYYEVIGISSGDSLEKVEKQEGIRTIAVNMTRKITPLKDIKALFKLYKIFKKEKPFIVHTHTPKAGTLGMIAAKLAGVPHRLHTIAGLPLLEKTGQKRKLLNAVEKLTYSCATLILPNSFALQDIIIKENFCAEHKLMVIANGSSNGIDTSHFDKKKISNESIRKLENELALNSDDTKFLFIGRIVKDKGINELITAFNNLNEDYSNMKLILVGRREPLLDPIAQETDNIIESNNNILEIGQVNDVRPYISISDILTFPSYREGFPNVVLQASCMGLPCIVSNINGCNEIISNNYNGLIVPPKDAEALEKAMKYLHNNKEVVHNLAEKARPNILKKYNRELVWKELLKLYNSLQ